MLRQKVGQEKSSQLRYHTVGNRSIVSEYDGYDGYDAFDDDGDPTKKLLARRAPPQNQSGMVEMESLSTATSVTPSNSFDELKRKFWTKFCVNPGKCRWRLGIEIFGLIVMFFILLAVNTRFINTLGTIFCQMTVGWGGNLWHWYHPFAHTNDGITKCSQHLHTYLYSLQTPRPHLDKSIINNNADANDFTLRKRQLQAQAQGVQNVENVQNQNTPAAVTVTKEFVEVRNECMARREKISISKIIHQTYFAWDDLPERWKLSPKMWKYYHPDWQYKFWDDDALLSFIKENYSWFLPIYQSYPHNIQRVDAARYFILYHYGGVYSDFDIAPKENIEPLLADFDTILVETSNLGLTNSLMMSRPNSTFFKYVMQSLEEYSQHWFVSVLPEHVGILFSTGPTAIWGMYGRYTGPYSGKDANKNDKIGILSKQAFGRLSVCSPEPGAPELMTIPKDFDTLLTQNMQSNKNQSWISLSKFENLNIISHEIGVKKDLMMINDPEMLKSNSNGLNDDATAIFENCGNNMDNMDNIKNKQMVGMFHHVTGNSWHSGMSTILNTVFGCQIGTFIFLITFCGWIGLNMYRLKHMDRARSVWIMRHFVTISGSIVLVVLLMFWSRMTFWFQQRRCGML